MDDSVSSPVVGSNDEEEVQEPMQEEQQNENNIETSSNNIDGSRRNSGFANQPEFGGATRKDEFTGAPVVVKSQKAPHVPAIHFEWGVDMMQEELKDQDMIKELRRAIPPKPGKRLYYTPTQVAQHNSERDCWISLLGKVFDITPLIASIDGALTKPLTAFAGQDLSHWFDSKTEDLRQCVDSETKLATYYIPHGRFAHVPPTEPTNDFATSFGEPWWRDDKYWIGYLSLKPRFIRVVNTLTKDEHTIEVCGEESILDIQNKYMAFNQHAESYIWKRLGKRHEPPMVPLEMDKTLEENAIPDESGELSRLNIDEEFYIPSLMIYFKDDLTAA